MKKKTTAKAKSIKAPEPLPYTLVCYMTADDRFVAMCRTKTEAVKLFRAQLNVLISNAKEHQQGFKVPSELRQKWIKELRADLIEAENSDCYSSLVCFVPTENVWYDTSDIDII